jgi:tetratricopeptide (TPR) repeat protein
MGNIIAAYESIIRKHLKTKEQIDFELTRVVSPIYMVVTNKRLLFFKEEGNTLNFIYDSDKLVEAWKAGKSSFKRTFAPAPSDIYLHLVLSFDKLDEGRDTCDILKEYILLNPELKLKEAIKIVENFSNFFPEKKGGYGGFGRAYFELGMVDKSAELLRIAAERMSRNNELQLAMYYLQFFI